MKDKDSISMADSIDRIAAALHRQLARLNAWVTNDPVRCPNCERVGCSGSCMADHCEICGEDRTGYLDDRGVCPECKSGLWDVDDSDPGDLTGYHEGVREDRSMGVET